MPSCEECKKLQKEDVHYHRRCETCEKNIKIDDLTPQAAEVIKIYNLVSSQLRIGGLGTVLGVDLVALRFVFEMFEVPVYKWAYISMWIINLINEAIIEPELERAKKKEKSEI